MDRAPSLSSSTGTSQADLSSGPPPINYSLRNRKKAIIIGCSIILVDSCILPIFLFYVLWFSKLSHSNAFNILSSVFGIPTLLQWGKRMWYLCKKDSDCRPIGGEKWRVDAFQISFTIDILLITLQIVCAVAPLQPIVPLFNMITETLLFLIGAQLIMHFFLFNLDATQRFRISSAPAGGFWRPGVYTLVEDIVAVDGGGGRRFREEWNARYEASPLFRRMLNRLDAFWGFGAVTLAGAVTAMVWTIPAADVYWAGWLLPFVWGAGWAGLTGVYVRRCLEEEHAGWKMGAMREAGLSMSESMTRPVPV
ncbi:hypothetical protein FIBSPDRAFT_872575 [Athelia psychrophila]|uniref:Uncharacterized protein n=1 Tax=Athelia psychrophila TaxID=1759441 RepID=A0A165ZE04_9AGAM|nr:hypothetical protein FIBSPDRAFT_872575 [Fibularhizoctonia sp. CBS 109695]